MGADAAAAAPIDSISGKTRAQLYAEAGLPAKGTAAPALFLHDGGRIACAAHGGNAFAAALRGAPRADTFWTPLGTWTRITEVERQVWRDMGEAEDFACESCPK